MTLYLAPTPNYPIATQREILGRGGVSEGWTDDAMTRHRFSRLMGEGVDELTIVELPVLGNARGVAIVLDLLNTQGATLKIHDLYGQTVELKGPLLRFAAHLLLSVSHEQGEKPAEWNGGQAPFGWRTNGKGNGLKAHPHEQRVREAVRRLHFRGGLNLKNTTQALQNEGLTRDGGEPYSYETIQRIVEGLRKEV